MDFSSPALDSCHNQNNTDDCPGSNCRSIINHIIENVASILSVYIH